MWQGDKIKSSTAQKTDREGKGLLYLGFEDKRRENRTQTRDGE